MRKNDPIKHIMSDQLYSVQRGQPVSAALRIMHEHGIHHVPVVDGDVLTGIVSVSDWMKLSTGAQGVETESMWSTIDAQHELIDVMTPDPDTLNESSVVRDAAEALSTGKYHSLPVVDSDKKLVGMVTSTDLIRYLCEQY